MTTKDHYPLVHFVRPAREIAKEFAAMARGAGYGVTEEHRRGLVSPGDVRAALAVCLRRGEPITGLMRGWKLTRGGRGLGRPAWAYEVALGRPGGLLLAFLRPGEPDYQSDPVDVTEIVLRNMGLSR